MANSIPASPYLTKEDMLYLLLKKEHGYYKSILQIAQEENDKLKSHQTLADLKSLLKKKKILLSCINEIDVAMAPLKKYWQSKTNRTDQPSEKIKLELDSLNKLLRELLQLDLLSQKTMENHLLFLREKNKQLSLQPSSAPKETHP